MDEPADYDIIRAVYEGLYAAHPNFVMRDVLRFLDEHPGIAALNKAHARNEGLRSSLQKDKDHRQKKGVTGV